MNTIEKEISFLGKIFCLKSVTSNNNLIDEAKYLCKECSELQFYFKEIENNKFVYWFKLNGYATQWFKTDVEAFNNVYSGLKDETLRMIETSNSRIKEYEKHLKHDLEILEKWKKCEDILEQLNQKCKMEISIKDIIE